MKGEAAHSMKKKLCFVAFYTVFFTLNAYSMAHAGPIEQAIDWVLQLLTSGIARSVAVIGCAVLGYMAFVGKLTWEKALSYVGGIVLVFGAATLVDALIGTVS